jgi:hypothetical protein
MVCKENSRICVESFSQQLRSFATLNFLNLSKVHVKTPRGRTQVEAGGERAESGRKSGRRLLTADFKLRFPSPIPLFPTLTHFLSADPKLSLYHVFLVLVFIGLQNDHA